MAKLNSNDVLPLLLNIREQFQGASTSDASLKDIEGTIALSPDNMILDDLPVLRNRSYNMYNNYPLATSIIDTITEFESNYKCVPNIENKELQKIVEYHFKEFSKNVTILNDNWDHFLELYKKSMLLCGEAYILVHKIRRPNSKYNTTFNLIDPDRVFTPLDKRDQKYLIKDGIQYNEIGVPVGFWVCKEVINDWESRFDSQRVVRNRNDQVTIRYEYNSEDFDYYDFYNDNDELQALHVYKKSRPNQSKGIPILAPVIKEIHSLHEYKNSEWYRLRISSCKGIFIKTDVPRENAINQRIDACTLVDSTGVDSTSCADTTSSDYDDLIDDLGISGQIETLYPGQIIYGKPGEDISTISQDSQNQSVYESHIMNSIFLISGAVKLPPFLFYPTWDEINFSSARAAINKYRSTLKDNHDFDTCNLVNPLYEVFIQELIDRIPELNGFKVEQLSKMESFAPVIQHVDIEKEVRAYLELINNKLMTRTQYFAERGMDFRDTIDTIAEEEAYIKSKGLSLEQVDKAIKQIVPNQEQTQTNKLFSKNDDK